MVSYLNNISTFGESGKPRSDAVDQAVENQKKVQKKLIEKLKNGGGEKLKILFSEKTSALL